jgi:hypothetical protein
MIAVVRGSGRLPVTALALAFGILTNGSGPVMADEDGYQLAAPVAPVPGVAVAPVPTELIGPVPGGVIGPVPGGPVGPGPSHNPHKKGLGTLGYGPPGLFPGFYGFGLGFHLDYGYGGKKALGMGVEGGYPFYAGPGYPHEPPPLRRFHHLLPYLYNGSSPCGFEYPFSVVEDIGPLVPNKPVMPGSGRADLGSGDPYNDDFGPFTGAFPYPETYFAPYASAAPGVSSAVRGPYPPMAAPGAGAARDLGIDAEIAVEADGTRGLKVSKVNPGTAAENAGLQVGDVIHSVNGYFTEQLGNVPWIIANAAPDGALKINVRSTKDGEMHTLTAQLP